LNRRTVLPVLLKGNKFVPGCHPVLGLYGTFQLLPAWATHPVMKVIALFVRLSSDLSSLSYTPFGTIRQGNYKRGGITELSRGSMYVWRTVYPVSLKGTLIGAPSAAFQARIPGLAPSSTPCLATHPLQQVIALFAALSRSRLPLLFNQFRDNSTDAWQVRQIHPRSPGHEEVQGTPGLSL
jgi:hypothetical protein